MACCPIPISLASWLKYIGSCERTKSIFRLVPFPRISKIRLESVISSSSSSFFIIIFNHHYQSKTKIKGFVLVTYPFLHPFRHNHLLQQEDLMASWICLQQLHYQFSISYMLPLLLHL